jgi:hypothetical protein
MNQRTDDYIYGLDHGHGVPAVEELVSINHPEERRRYPIKIAGMIKNQINNAKGNVNRAERELEDARQYLANSKAQLVQEEKALKLLRAEADRFADFLPSTSKVVQGAREDHAELTDKEEKKQAAIAAEKAREES